MIIYCEVCREKEKTRVSGGMYTCDNCYGEYFFPYLKFTDNIGGEHRNISRKRNQELSRRAVLPDKRRDGNSDYYVGRLNEKGKIEDRDIDITP